MLKKRQKKRISLKYNVMRKDKYNSKIRKWKIYVEIYNKYILVSLLKECGRKYFNYPL